MESLSEVEEELLRRRLEVPGVTMGEDVAAAVDEDEEQHLTLALVFVLMLTGTALDTRVMRCDEDLHTLKASILVCGLPRRSRQVREERMVRERWSERG